MLGLFEEEQEGQSNPPTAPAQREDWLGGEGLRLRAEHVFSAAVPSPTSSPSWAALLWGT